MRLLLSISLALLVFAAASCSKETENNLETSETKAFTLNCWVHHLEKDHSPQVQIFEPCGTNQLGLARFRMQFELRKDGSAQFMVLAPNDAHYSVDGSWDYNSSNNQLQLIDPNGAIAQRYQILKSSAGELQLSPLP